MSISAPTLGDMVDLITDDLARTDIDAQIRQSIQLAIRHFQSERLFFDRQYVTFNTGAGQAFYGSAANALIPNLFAIYSSTIAESGTTYPLSRVDDEWLESIATPVETGTPCWFSYATRQVRLYPIPDQAYAVRMLCQAPVAAPVNDTDTNPWTDEAQELILARAKWRLAKHVLRDKALASDMEDAMADSINELRGRTARAEATGVVQSYEL